MWNDLQPPTAQQLAEQTSARRSGIVMMFALGDLTRRGIELADMRPAVHDPERDRWIIACQVRIDEPGRRGIDRRVAQRIYLWRVGDSTLTLVEPVEGERHRYAPRPYDVDTEGAR